MLHNFSWHGRIAPQVGQSRGVDARSAPAAAAGTAGKRERADSDAEPMELCGGAQLGARTGAAGPTPDADGLAPAKAAKVFEPLCDESDTGSGAAAARPPRAGAAEAESAAAGAALAPEAGACLVYVRAPGRACSRGWGVGQGEGGWFQGVSGEVNM